MSVHTSSSSPLQKVSTREIWSLTWPQALMMLFQFLVGFTDVIVAGRIHSDVQAALGIITQCQFFLLVIGMALANGGIAAMSQSLGAGLRLRAKRYAGLIFTVAAMFCVGIVTLGYIFRHSFFLLLEIPQSIMPLTNQLWVLFLFVLPFNYLTIVTVSVFRSQKNVWIPLFSGIIVCFVNYIGNYGLGLGYFGMPKLGAPGLVYASICAVGLGALFNVLVLWRRGFITRQTFAPLRWQKKALPYILKVAIPAGGTQFLWQLGYLVLFFITATLPHGSVTALAGLTAGMRLEALIFLPGLAFSFTGSVLVGHCLGAGNKEEARRVGMRVAAAGALIMSMMAAILYIWIDQITAYIAPEPTVQQVALSYMHYNLLATPFTVTSMIMTGIMTGAGATIYMMLVNSGATWCIRLPLAWYLGHIVLGSATGVFIAMLASQAVQAASAWCVFMFLDWYKFASTSKRFKREV